MTNNLSQTFKKEHGKTFTKMEPAKRIVFFMENETMRDEYLGDCLDSIRWGRETNVMYNLGTSGMIQFIQRWMDLNRYNLANLWNKKESPQDFSLPHINNPACPISDIHKGTYEDLGGRVRCAHKETRMIREGFFNSGMIGNKIWYDNIEPHDPVPDDGYDENDEVKREYRTESDKYEKQMERYSAAKLLPVLDVCGEVISDAKMVLSLEEILDRINLEPRYSTVYCNYRTKCRKLAELSPDKKEMYELLKICPGHKEENTHTIHDFNGRYLAGYVQEWHKQLSECAPLFKRQRVDRATPLSVLTLK